MVVRLRKDKPRNWVQRGKNVSCWSVIFPTKVSGTELTIGHQQVNVVGAHIILGHSDDCLNEWHFSMMVGWVFGDVTCQLCDFYFFCELPLKTTVDNLSLSWLESIDQRTNWSAIVLVGEVNELPVDKFFVPDFGSVIWNWQFWIVIGKPSLAVFNSFLAENQFNSVIVLLIHILKIDSVFSHVTEILFGFLVIWSTKTFVILDVPCVEVGHTLSPNFKVTHGVKRYLVVPLADFKKRSDKLFDESGHLEQTGPEVMNKVNHQTLDVGTVSILIRHNHNGTVPQWFGVFILFVES